MRVAAVGESLLERLALRANLVALPLIESQIAYTSARALMAGSEVGVFDALEAGPRDADGVAKDCRTDPVATRRLLDCLVAMGYLRWRRGTYANTRSARRWLVRSSPVSMADKLHLQATTEWAWLEDLEEHVRTGEALDLHRRGLSADQWAQYQDGMRATSVGIAPLVARKVPMPPSPTAMLDIGGSHGLYSVALCRRYPTLSSTILELPGAAPEASRLVAREQTDGRVRVRAGNALTDDLGEEQYDLVLMANVAHHFSAAENEGLARRVARALKPGGYYAIGEFERPARPGAGGTVVAVVDLYFSLTSASGAWGAADMSRWQRAAGLTPQRHIRYTVLPGFVTISARKPS
jgi:SAM-dependent methyltransferase